MNLIALALQKWVASASFAKVSAATNYHGPTESGSELRFRSRPTSTVGSVLVFEPSAAFLLLVTSHRTSLPTLPAPQPSPNMGVLLLACITVYLHCGRKVQV